MAGSLEQTPSAGVNPCIEVFARHDTATIQQGPQNRSSKTSRSQDLHVKEGTKGHREKEDAAQMVVANLFCSRVRTRPQPRPHSSRWDQPVARPALVPDAMAPPAKTAAAPHTEGQKECHPQHGVATSISLKTEQHVPHKHPTLQVLLTLQNNLVVWNEGQACGAPVHAVEARSTAALEAVPRQPAQAQAQVLALLQGQEPLEPLMAGVVAAKPMKTFTMHPGMSVRCNTTDSCIALAEHQEVL